MAIAALVVMTFGRDPPWDIWNFIDLSDHHAMIRQESTYLSLSLEFFVKTSRAAVLDEYRAFHLDVDEYGPICCQLLDYADALRITEGMHPNDLLLLLDESRHVMRIDARDAPTVNTDEDVYWPYSRNKTTCFYWRLILHIVYIH
jgi:hypothetical protein